MITALVIVTIVGLVGVLVKGWRESAEDDTTEDLELR